MHRWPFVKGLINTLNLINETKSMNVTLDNVYLNVGHLMAVTSVEMVNGILIPTFANSTSSTVFNWTYSLNGIEYNHVVLNFDHGTMNNLQDDRGVHPIGRTDVVITKEQAINKVAQYLSNYTNKFNLTISSASARLIGYPRNYSSLYPTWYVLIGFNEPNVQEVGIKVWADTGEIFECYQGGSPLNMGKLVMVPWLATTLMPKPTAQVPESSAIAAPTITPGTSNETANAQIQSSITSFQAHPLQSYRITHTRQPSNQQP